MHGHRQDNDAVYDGIEEIAELEFLMAMFRVAVDQEVETVIRHNKRDLVEVIIIIDVWGTVKIDDHKPIGYEDSRNGL